MKMVVHCSVTNFVMPSRGESFGGGQSSLGYLFGPEGDQPGKEPPPLPKVVDPPYGIDKGGEEDQPGKEPLTSPSKVIDPPYGIDTGEDEEKRSSQKQGPNVNNYHRAEGQNSGNFITDRPTTKVKYVPGGNSSLGYLFGDQ